MILQATQQDLPELMALYRSLIGTPGCIWSTEYPFLELAEEDVERGYVFVMRMGGRLIATITVETPEDIADLDWTSKRPCELARLGVAQEYQGQGLGATMLQFALYKAMERGHDGAILLVNPAHEAAVALYRKHGFARCGDLFMYERNWDRYELCF
ncbi:MAG: GNAT family N-acetyltransferase [Clostridiales bacterium]|nr:GNAT family N-acetyltransferase [Clostridiales bacterium]